MRMGPLDGISALIKGERNSLSQSLSPSLPMCPCTEERSCADIAENQLSATEERLHQELN